MWQSNQRKDKKEIFPVSYTKSTWNGTQRKTSNLNILSVGNLWCKTFQNTKVFTRGIELVQINLPNWQVGLESLKNFLAAFSVRKPESSNIQLGVSSQEVKEI